MNQSTGNHAAATTTIRSSTVTDIVGRTDIESISDTAVQLAGPRIRDTKRHPLAGIPWVVAVRIRIGLKSDGTNQGRQNLMR